MGHYSNAIKASLMCFQISVKMYQIVFSSEKICHPPSRRTPLGFLIKLQMHDGNNSKDNVNVCRSPSSVIENGKGILQFY